MEDETTTNDVFPLLELPAGLETVLLPFVASGTGVLLSLLNLRQVCATTKSWVDTLPPRQGKPLFSKAQVRMDSDVDTIERFLESPPPSGVSALSLDIKDVIVNDPPAEEEEVWNRFCSVWTPRLETLELRNEGDVEDSDEVFNNRRIFSLLESPDLRVLHLAPIRIVWNQPSPIPSSFSKVTELSINFSDVDGNNGALVRDVFLKLEVNPNLRKFETFIHDVTEFEFLTEFIDAKKEEARLEMNLHLDNFFPPHDGDDDVEEEDGVEYLEFAKSVVASKSTIRLRASISFRLENVVAFLPRHIALEMFGKIEVIETWEPSGDTLSLLESLPRLKQVRVETGRDGVNFEGLTFPPSLEELSFFWGFPARAALPEALRSLTLEEFACNGTEFVNSLAFLKTQCAGLETLNVTWNSWKCEGSEAPAVNIEESPGFANLRSLTLNCNLSKNDVESCLAVLRGLQVETLQLHHLALLFKRFQWRGYLPVLDAPFLTGLCEGPVGNSLVMVDIQKECVTADGLPLLARLASLAAANAKSREEREGRGRWQRQWEIIK